MSSSSTGATAVHSDRVRRLIYQASYTGMKETDLLLGHFARKCVSEPQIEQVITLPSGPIGFRFLPFPPPLLQCAFLLPLLFPLPP